MSKVRVIVRKLFGMPNLLRMKLHNYIISRKCISCKGTKFAAGSMISNHQGKKDKIIIGENCLIHGRLQIFSWGGFIKIGDYSFISEGSRIWSSAGIFIGNRVLISHNVNVIDSNSHSLSAKSRHREYKSSVGLLGLSDYSGVVSKEIFIEDDVWIGFNAVILKGVRVGRGAIVAANAVVTKDVEDYSIVAGNPARVVGKSFE